MGELELLDRANGVEGHYEQAGGDHMAQTLIESALSGAGIGLAPALEIMDGPGHNGDDGDGGDVGDEEFDSDKDGLDSSQN